MRRADAEWIKCGIGVGRRGKPFLVDELIRAVSPNGAAYCVGMLQVANGLNSMTALPPELDDFMPIS